MIGVANYFVRPWVHQYLPNMTARAVVTVITLLLMSPFLKALIGWETILPVVLAEKMRPLSEMSQKLCRFSFCKSKVVQKVKDTLSVCETENLKNLFISNNQVATVYYKLWKAKKANRLPLLFLTSFRMLIVCFFIMTVVHQFLTENNKVIFGLVIISLVMLSQSRWLFEQYMKIEKQFLDNLNGRDASQKAEKEDTAEK